MKLVLKLESEIIALVQEGNEFYSSTVLMKKGLPIITLVVFIYYVVVIIRVIVSRTVP